MYRVALIAVLLLVLFVPCASAQWFNSSWCWTDLGDDQAALWHNGVQVGAIALNTLTYYPRYGPGRWGAPEDAPVQIPQKYIDRYNALNKKKNHWRENGVMGPNGESTIPNSGLRIIKPKRGTPKGKPSPPPKIRTYPQAVLPAGANEVPAFDDMASITFVSNDDGRTADAALEIFRTAPELAAFQDKYAIRAKAYPYEDFAHTCGSFKLDQDVTFAKTGFVAIVNPTAPNDDDRAPLEKIYEFSSPAQFAGALRDADSRYNPNPPDAPALQEEWSTAKVVTAGGLGLASVVGLAIGLGKRARQKRLGII